MKQFSFTQESILSYWKKFFPEYSQSQFEECISAHDIIDVTKLTDVYNSYNNIGDFCVNKYASFDVNPELTACLAQIDKNDQLFVPFIQPLLNDVFKSLSEYCSTKNFICNDTFLKALILLLFQLAKSILFRTIIYEFNYLSDNNSLTNTSNKGELAYFIEDYCTPNYVRKFCEEYQMIVKLTSQKIHETYVYIIEVIDKIEQEQNEIKSRYKIDVFEDPITSFVLGNGDLHNKCKSVAVINTQSGKHFLFKPHSMQIDLGFSSLLNWLYENGSGIHQHKTSEIIAGVGYGFSDFTEFQECKSEDEVKAFYERSGELLCILYSLNGADMHFENIIAAGEYPVLIDLETLLHPSLHSSKDELKTKSSCYIATNQFASSVVSIGMLPFYIGNKLDVGGFGALQEQQSSFKLDFVVNDGNNTIRVERRYGRLIPKKNNPSYNGQTINAKKYSKEICEGFQKLYNWIMRNQNLYLQKIKELFYGSEGRVIVRPTFQYVQLLNIALRQEFSRKDFERQMILHRIFINDSQENSAITQLEYQDLLNHDVPYFSYVVGDTKLYKNGKAVSEEGTLDLVLDCIETKVKQFSESDLLRQEEYIRLSFVTREDFDEVTNIHFIDHSVNTENWLQTAKDIGDLIIQNAIEGHNAEGKNDASWIGVTLEGIEEDLWVPSVLGNEMYNGNCGIALFLTQLGKITGNNYYFEYAEKALRTVTDQYRLLYKKRDLIIGAFTGVSGLAYTASHLARATSDEEWKQIAEEALLACESHAQNDIFYDFISGAAGALAVTFSAKDLLFQCSPEINTRIIKILAKHLSDSVNTDDKGAGWSQNGKERYAGFAHGNAGINPYLYRAAKELQEDSYLDILKLSGEFEQSLYVPSKGWYRSEKNNQITSLWCHGSAGILLSKLLLRKEGYQSETLSSSIESAIQIVKKEGFGKSPTYCHGDLGNLAILDFAGQTLNDVSLRNSVFNTFQEVYTGTIENNWNYKQLKSCNSYGLMIGLSGWGYSLLSHYTNFKIPQFLWLE